MLIEAPRRTDDGVTIVITPDGAEPIRTSVTVAGGLLLDTTVDPVVPAALLPAMHRGEALRAAGDISPRLRVGADQFQRIPMSWDRHLFGEKALLRMARIEAAERRTVELGEDGRGTACFFTAGADSFHSVITNRDRLDALIHVRGFGTPPDGTPLSAMIEERLRDAARLLGLPLIEIATDLKHVGDVHEVSWDVYHGSALAAIGLLLSPHFSRILIPATDTYADLVPLGSHPLIDPLWSTERVEIVHDGADATRIDKLRTAAGHPAGRLHLQVCWQHLNDEYNCGVCEKCVRTGVAIRLAGLDGAFPGLPTPRARRVARVRPAGRGRAWVQLDALARTSDQRALSWAIRAARTRHRIGRIEHPLRRR